VAQPADVSAKASCDGGTFGSYICPIEGLLHSPPNVGIAGKRLLEAQDAISGRHRRRDQGFAGIPALPKAASITDLVISR
jgi:hypothetical protein